MKISVQLGIIKITIMQFQASFSNASCSIFPSLTNSPDCCLDTFWVTSWSHSRRLIYVGLDITAVIFFNIPSAVWTCWAGLNLFREQCLRFYLWIFFSRCNWAGGWAGGVSCWNVFVVLQLEHLAASNEVWKKVDQMWSECIWHLHTVCWNLLNSVIYMFFFLS